MAERDHTGRTVAILGGAGLLAWLLFRGKGRGPGAGPGTGIASLPATRCVVWIRAAGISIDGVAADLETVVARCRQAGEAEVHVTGAASQRVFDDVRDALRDAGVKFSVHDHSFGAQAQSPASSSPSGSNP